MKSIRALIHWLRAPRLHLIINPQDLSQHSTRPRLILLGHRCWIVER